MTAPKPKQVRWECPTGEHPGVLGSTRPAKDSVIRYCLPCTTQSSKLVPRVAPALEAKRERAATTAAAKAKAKRAREAKARAKAKQAETERHTVEGVDLRVEFARLIGLRVFGGKRGKLYRNPPEFVVTKRTTTPQRRGYAEPWRNRITVARYPYQSSADARETLLHELVHIHVGQERDTGAWHGTEFKNTLRLAMKEAYKVDPIGLPGDWGRYAAALYKKESGEK